MTDAPDGVWATYPCMPDRPAELRLSLSLSVRVSVGVSLCVRLCVCVCERVDVA